MPRVTKPTQAPRSQFAPRTADLPSTIHQTGSRTAVAMSARAAVRATGGMCGMIRLAAGRPAAQIAIEARQIRFDAIRVLRVVMSKLVIASA